MGRPTERRNRESEVIEAAILVFHSKGYASATIQDVAEAVGMLKGSLYHYISSKEELLFRILRESHDQARTIMSEVSALDAPAIERLRIYLERMHLWYCAHIERAGIYLTQQHHLTGERRAEMRLQARDFEHFLRELLAEAKGAGALRPNLDLKLASFFVLGALNSLPRWYHSDGPYPAERIAEEFASMAMRVMVADPPTDQLSTGHRVSRAARPRGTRSGHG